MAAPDSTPGKDRGHSSLRRRLVLGLGSIVLVTALVAALGVALFVDRTERARWRDRQGQAANDAARAVATFVGQAQDYLSLISLLDSDYLVGQPGVLRNLLGQNPAFLEIIRLDAGGNVLAAAYRDEPVMANLFTIPQSNWFLEAHSGQPYVGQVQISAEYEPYIIMALPAPDGGVTAARLRMDVLRQVVSDIRFGQTGQAYVTNRRGEIVVHPDPEVVLARTSLAVRPEFTSVLQSAGGRWHGEYTNFAGEEVVGTTAVVPEVGWILFTELSRAEASATTRQALLVLGGVMILGGLVVGVGAYKLMQHAVFVPLNVLRDGAQRIGQGDLDHRIPTDRQDEIGQVAEEFNEMARRLQERETALRQARDKAMEASQFKGQLLANVSHDLRTPLNAILGFAEMMAQGLYGDLDEEQLQPIERIVVNSHRLLNLINSLLDQAQIEAGTLTLIYGEFVPGPLLEEVKAVTDDVARDKGLDLTFEVAPEVPLTLISDAQRVYQIVVNLVDNALKFTWEGSVRVRLYLPDESHWGVEVADTGPGVPPEAESFIFEPFRQVDGSPTRRHHGIGLGLSIVKQLTALLGGEVHLNSEVGQGSIFTVVLPLDASLL